MVVVLVKFHVEGVRWGGVGEGGGVVDNGRRQARRGCNCIDERMVCCVSVNFRDLVVELVLEEAQTKMVKQNPL